MDEKGHQGSSIYTPRKEYELSGLSYMRATQFKSKWFPRKYNEVLVADVFCGTGKNVIGDEWVDGSPVRLIDGIKRAQNNLVRFSFWFSDKKQSSCDSLKALIRELFQVEPPIRAMLASDAVNYLGNYMYAHPYTYLILVLDPNGPTEFPKHEVIDLIRSFSNRLDVVPYISATVINRCLGARQKAGYELTGWLGEIENFDEGFISCLTSNDRHGWIRALIPGDRFHWTMVPTYGGFLPRSDWKKQGYYVLNSPEGLALVEKYCGGFIDGK